MVNKFIKALAYTGVHILVGVQIYLISMVIASPILSIVYGILDLLKKVPSFLEGKYLIAWALLSLAIWLVMYIYVEVKTNDFKKDFKTDKDKK